jgi:galactose mutarotase-like enzyme
MKPCGVITASEQGYTVKGLRSPTAELLMVPELGGRIISLRSLRTGREWCWHQPRPDWLWSNQAGDSFGVSPQAGLDECVPTVAACHVKGRSLPDHGEVWYQDWQLDPEALEADILKASLSLTVSPFIFSRAIRVREDGAFEFDYTLSNTGADAEPFLWSLHPLLNIGPGDRVELTADVRSLRLDGGLGTPIQRGDVWAYPEPFSGVRLDQCQVPGMFSGCVKGYAGPLERGFAALVNDQTGESLELRWDAQAIPFLGLWINRGHGGFHHVALEPCSGAPDSLAEAVESWHQHGTIQPGATVSWSISLNIS